jgi:TatD DNase family protein
MTLFDTHCHLDRQSFDEGADAVLERARAAGVSRVLCVGVGGREQARHAVELAERRADVLCSAGVHPHDAASLDAELEAELAELVERPSVAAVGEVGLDFHYDHSPRPLQAEVFRRFIALAKRVNKPIIVHTRSAPQETLEILSGESARDVGGVIHCFSEDRAFAERALDLDFDLSFSGIVTFKNARSIQEVAAWAPEDRILIETDSPYLAPVPFRGKKCEPAFVAHTATKVAELRGVSLSRLAEATTANACRRFRVPLD